VLESQSSGLPVLVSNQGGPKEVVDEGITGFILPGDKPAAWLEAAVRLITDDDLRRRMGRSAQMRSQRYTIASTFEHFWQQHLAAAQQAWLGAADEAPHAAPLGRRDRIDDEEPAAAG
jgi:glycosyltransferase involved in cell wall biosynthesis